MALVLHDFWRSGASHRVRIALALKGLAYDTAAVDLRAGAHRSGAYADLNPQRLVPALETADGVITQSLAIIEWLEERFPEPPLLPKAPEARARARAIAAAVACDIHPLGNLRVLAALRESFGADEAAVRAWALRWIAPGLAAIERMACSEGPWAVGAAPTLADCALVPQLYAATSRYGYDLEAHPRLARIARAATAHPAFEAAHPERRGGAS